MESRKKGIVISVTTAIVAYNPDTYIKLAVCALIVVLAGYAIRWQGSLDKEKKVIDKPPTLPVE